MAENCDATNDAGRSSVPTPGSGSSDAYWSATNIYSSFTWLSSISPASGSHYGNVFETRSRYWVLATRYSAFYAARRSLIPRCLSPRRKSCAMW